MTAVVFALSPLGLVVAVCVRCIATVWPDETDRAVLTRKKEGQA